MVDHQNIAGCFPIFTAKYVSDFPHVMFLIKIQQSANVIFTSYIRSLNQHFLSDFGRRISQNMMEKNKFFANFPHFTRRSDRFDVKETVIVIVEIMNRKETTFDISSRFLRSPFGWASWFGTKHDLCLKCAGQNGKKMKILKVVCLILRRHLNSIRRKKWKIK